MEQDFLAKMGINPDVIKDPNEYIREEATQSNDPGINDTDLFANRESEEEEPDVWELQPGETVRHEKFLKSIGLDISKLSPQQVKRINSICDPKNLSEKESTIFFKSLGVNIHKLVNVIRERLENCKEGDDPDEGRIDICVKVGRNEKCPCNSGKKFKKCCESKVADYTPPPPVETVVE